MGFLLEILWQMLIVTQVSIGVFDPASQTVSAGDSAISSVEIRNAAESEAVVWVGYSIMSPTGLWFDIPANRVAIPRNSSRKVARGWVVPDSAEVGDYRVVMALWSAPPESPGATRLAKVEKPAAFAVKGSPLLLINQPDSIWRTAGHRLGRGRMRPDQVRRIGDRFALRVLAGTCDGAEIRTVSPISFGRYTARIKLPYAPGSLSAFFLYGSNAGDRNDEIDIEIFNDGSRRALLTAWIKGRKTQEATVTLPFDPAAAVHEYSIQWGANELRFLADGQSLSRWRRHYPKAPMRLMASVWWPAWLKCVPVTGDVQLEVEKLLLEPAK